MMSNLYVFFIFVLLFWCGYHILISSADHETKLVLEEKQAYKVFPSYLFVNTMLRAVLLKSDRLGYRTGADVINPRLNQSNLTEPVG